MRMISQGAEMIKPLTLKRSNCYSCAYQLSVSCPLCLSLLPANLALLPPPSINLPPPLSPLRQL